MPVYDAVMLETFINSLLANNGFFYQLLLAVVLYLAT